MLWMLDFIPCQAGIKYYKASLNESKWIFKGTPIQCQLSHSIPFYGQAQFQQYAGKKTPLFFQLSYKKEPIHFVKYAQIHSVNADWFPQQSPRFIGKIPIYSGKYIFKTDDFSSWRLLNELELGRFPTFRYQNLETQDDHVLVALSTIGFKHVYNQFLSCLKVLRPHRLDELTRLTLHFDFNQSKIKQKYFALLKSLAAYIRYQPNLEMAFIKGYADAKGSRNYNHQLSKRRINAVKKILQMYGASDKKLTLLPFGERYPVATNRKAWGRAKNRRVYIQIHLSD
jgi:outer membrane protein OmpA-like peptidoglycan-associated protein